MVREIAVAIVPYQTLAALTCRAGVGRKGVCIVTFRRVPVGRETASRIVPSGNVGQ